MTLDDIPDYRNVDQEPQINSIWNQECLELFNKVWFQNNNPATNYSNFSDIDISGLLL